MVPKGGRERRFEYTDINVQLVQPVNKEQEMAPDIRLPFSAVSRLILCVCFSVSYTQKHLSLLLLPHKPHHVM